MSLVAPRMKRMMRWHVLSIVLFSQAFLVFVLFTALAWGSRAARCGIFCAVIRMSPVSQNRRKTRVARELPR